MSALRVRAYNVRFGDAILVSVPEKDGGTEVTRHILIDVGNVLSGRGGDESVFEPVVADIERQLGNNPVDLYVMTHEHMDHVKGLLHASTNLQRDIKARYAWLTASAEEGYYDRFPAAKEQRKKLIASYDAIERYLSLTPAAATPWARALLANNNPSKTGDCVKHLRHVAPVNNTTYVYRDCDLKNRHPFTEAKFEIWAPEQDTSEYYGRFQPMALAFGPAGQATGSPTLVNPVPPPGVDAGAFYDLVGARRRGWGDNLLAIDKAANNTSVVFCLEWRGWRLLFPGDAEQRSWKTMARHGALGPVHFLKVGHHGSHNGTPPADLLEQLFPLRRADARERHAVLSTCDDCYHGVPDSDTLDELAKRCKVSSVQDVGDGEYVDIVFDGTSP
jgi:beta-lactamase superfamily II metal-dependent hydrolase